MKRFLISCAAAALVAVAFSGSASARATFTVINADGVNEGFNDPTPVAPVGGNPGTTLGQQRLIAFQFAADIWGCILDSDQTIRVRAQFNPLTCTTTSGTLGSTGAQSVWRDFAGAPLAATWFVDSEADALNGTSLGGVTQDMNSTFNSNLGTATCLPTSPWYLGLDLNGPPGSIDLVTVLLHEFGHGLGFASTVNRTTGALLSSFIDVYSRHLYDDTAGLHWDAMTNAQRLASITNNGNLVWDGPNVNAVGSPYLCKAAKLDVLTPPAVAGTYVAPLASFSACEPNVTAPVEEIVDNTPPTSDGCEVIQNDLTGKIALIDRGTCAFVIKVKAAQDAGAVGVIMVNNVAGTPIEMGGSDPTIVIPAVMVSQTDGNAIRAQLGSGVTATIGTDPSAWSGADNAGHLKMYAPNPSVAGSSTSHWDVSARPNLLMEPNINADLDHSTDLTPSLLKDILWTFNVAPHALAVGTYNVQGNLAGCMANVDAADLDAGSSDSNGDALTFSLVPPGPYPTGHNNVLFVVSDGCLTDSAPVDIVVECPIPVKLTAFSVTRAAEGAVITWGVEDATDHLGFHVFRQENGGEKVKISSQLQEGRTQYTFVDTEAPAGGADYWLVEYSRSGDPTWYGPITLQASSARATLSLSHVTPNPFRYSTRIAYALPYQTDTRITIHDAQGRLVRHLVEGTQGAGNHEQTWDGQFDNGAPAPSGLYFVMLQAGETILHQKVLLDR